LYFFTNLMEFTFSGISKQPGLKGYGFNLRSVLQIFLELQHFAILAVISDKALTVKSKTI